MSGIYQIHKLTSEVSIELLKMLGKGSVLPFLVVYSVLKIKFPQIQKKQLRDRIHYYKRNHAIVGDAVNGYSLSQAGIERLHSLSFSKINQAKKWDQKWRIIAFDIPESKREARDAVRRLIKELGCHQLQRSLWVHPLPCLDHFKKIQKAYNARADIILLEVDWIDNHDLLLRQFQKQYPDLI